MKKVIVLLILLVAIVTGCGSNNMKNVEEKIKIGTISGEEVKDIIDNYDDYPNIDIIDVRTEEEYLEGHIPKAKNIPLDEISNIKLSKEREIIVYCRSGVRSKSAAEKLKELGYENIKDLGGIDNYNYELEK